MKSTTLLVTALVVAGQVATTTAAARFGQQGTSALDIVEVVGCLTEGPNNTWVLTKATDPVVSKTVFTTKEALKEAEAKPEGTQRFRLLGVSAFSPSPHKGHKMAVKGVLIKDPTESRINITSLQMVAAACSK